jgi:hypothetical protein
VQAFTLLAAYQSIEDSVWAKLAVNRVRSCSGLSAEGGGAAASVFAEMAGEVTAIGEPAVRGDFEQVLVGALQKLLGPIDPLLNDELVRRATC